MKNTTGYTINYAEETIVITKKFAKAASVINSYEYDIMVQLRKDQPNFKIRVKEIKKKQGKKSYKGLTLKVMKDFFDSKEEADKKAFRAARVINNDKYASVKSWFLNNYEEEYNEWCIINKINLEETENEAA